MISLRSLLDLCDVKTSIDYSRGQYAIRIEIRMYKKH